MKPLWDRIEQWLRNNELAVFESLRRGASEKAIQKLEKKIKERLPDEVRLAYLRHDGQEFESPGMLDGWRWLPLEELALLWDEYKEVISEQDDLRQVETDERFVHSVWWQPKWIPISDSGDQSSHCVDLNPGPQGTTGQIIQLWTHDTERNLVSSGMNAWIEAMLKNWETGNYVNEDGAGLYPL